MPDRRSIGVRRAMARLLVLVGLVVASSHALALELVDDRGVRVVLEQPPQRIVSILPSLTEMVCDLGQCQRIVGKIGHTPSCIDFGIAAGLSVAALVRSDGAEGVGKRNHRFFPPRRRREVPMEEEHR